MMYHWKMRTTITLDDEVHEFAAYYARVRGLTLGMAIDELIGETGERQTTAKPDAGVGPNGLPMFPPPGERSRRNGKEARG